MHARERLTGKVFFETWMPPPTNRYSGVVRRMKKNDWSGLYEFSWELEKR